MLALATVTSAGAKSYKFPQRESAWQQDKRTVTFEWGATAGLRFNGVNLIWQSNDLGMIANARMGFNLGLHTAVTFAEIIALQPELNYGYSATKLSFSGEGKWNSRLSSNDIEMPILISVRALPVVRLNVGPVFTLMSEARYKDDADNGQFFGNMHPTYGYALGASVCLAEHYLIDARFTGYFNRTYGSVMATNFVQAKDVTMRTYWLGIKFGYLF